MLAAVLLQVPAWASVDAGKTWLIDQVTPSGQISSEVDSVALPLQVRSEAASALARVQANVPTPLLQGVENASTAQTTEFLVRQALAQALAGQSPASKLAVLIAVQNADGGFGTAAGLPSNPQDTAWALMALADDQAATPVALQALGRLTGTQQPGGAWQLMPDGDAVVTTALAAQALGAYSRQAGAQAALANARAWLLAQRNAAQTWAGDLRTAHALLATLPGLPDVAEVQAAIDALSASQRADGSWGGDPYVTALALQALWLATQPFPNPDLSDLTGQVVDASTNTPVDGAVVRLVGSDLQAVTGADGRFTFTQLQVLADQIEIQATGYLSVAGDVLLTKGRVTDLGIIGLTELTAGNSTTVTISGTARYSDDGVNFVTARNAVIQVGAQTTTANNQGEYTLDGVPAGPIELQASYGSYPVQQASFTGQAGQQLRFDPRFIKSTAPGQNALLVIVTDQVSGQPIAGASVSLNGLVRSTAANGEVTFNTNILAGDNSVVVSMAGYETRLIAMSVQGTQTIRLPVSLAQASGGSGQTVLQGIVTDAGAGLPLAGAVVGIQDSAYSATTSAEGRYQLALSADFGGTRTVLIEKTGYQTHSQTLSLTKGRTHQFDVPLHPVADASQPAQMGVHVVDKVTRLPVAGATITLSGSNPHMLATDAAGMARFTALNAGATQVQVAAPGYDNAAFVIELTAGIDYQVPVELTPKGVGTDRLYGRVIDAQTRLPLAGAKVTLMGTDMLETTADAGGNYQFSDITLGRWNLSATAAGYLGSSRALDIAASTSTDIPLTSSHAAQGGTGTLRAVAVGHPNNSSAAVGYLFVFGEPGTSGQVTSNDGKFDVAYTIDASGVAEIAVPSTQFLSPAGQVLDKALLVHANAPISASFLNREQYTTDMTYLLDVSALGTSHRVMAWEYGGGYVQMSVTAVEDGTVATVTPAKALTTGQPAGQPFDVTLNKGQSVYFTASAGNDLTGTLVQSSKPVAVFGGFQCANVPNGMGYCDHVFSQLPPVNHWASQYIVPETAQTGSAGNLVRILAHTDGTQVSIDGDSAITLNAGQFHEIASAKDLRIDANQPVLVGQYLKGRTAAGNGDPAFSFIAGIRQTLRDYIFTAPVNLAKYDLNFLNIAIPTSALGSLQLNGVVVDTGDFRAVAGTAYSTGRIAIAAGPGRITADQPFLATISGFSIDDSYHTIIGVDYSTGASGVLNPVLARVGVSTDQPAYPASTPALLSGAVVNYGSRDGRLRLALRLVDAQGQEVARFGPYDLGTVAAGATVNHSETWNTGTHPAGVYTLIGTLLDENDQVLDIASTLLLINPGSVADAPRAALTVSTDKALYQPDDRVLISNLLRNLTTNAALDDASVVLKVFDPAANLVFSHVHDVGQLTAGALRTLEVPQSLKGAPLGTYTVEATLIGSGNNLKSAQMLAKAYDTNIELARATTRYQVVQTDNTQEPGSHPGANADYAIAKRTLTPHVKVGEQLIWEIVVTNNGPQDGLGVSIEDLLPTSLDKAQWTCTVSGQSICGTDSGTGDVQLEGIVFAGSDNRITIVVAGIATTEGEVLNTASIKPANGGMDDDDTNNRNSAQATVSSHTVVPIPVNTPGGLLLLALLLALCIPVRYRPCTKN